MANNPSSLLSSIHVGNCLEQGTPGDALAAAVTGAGIRLADVGEEFSPLNWCQIRPFHWEQHPRTQSGAKVLSEACESTTVIFVAALAVFLSGRKAD